MTDYVQPFYPMRDQKGHPTNLWGLENDVKRAQTTAIVLAPEGVRHERSWCVRDRREGGATSGTSPPLAVVLPSWDWSVDGGPQGHDRDLLRAMLFAEAAVHVVDLERQAEGLGPSRPGPLYLLAARMIRDAIGETKAYREALLTWTIDSDSPKVKAAAWAHAVASWPEDGLYQDGDGKQRDPLDVLAWGASWPRNDGAPPWYDLAIVIVDAARRDVIDVKGEGKGDVVVAHEEGGLVHLRAMTAKKHDEERRRIAHPAAVWARVERALAECLPKCLPKLVSSRQW